MRATDTSKVRELERRVRSMLNFTIEVGIFGTAGSEILMRATVHEFGAPTMNIPERSFIRAGFDRYQSTMVEEIRTLIPFVLEGAMTVESAQALIGESFVSKIKQYLTDLKEPPLKEATIRRKGSTNPLIDTGQMRDSITWRVKSNV